MSIQIKPTDKQLRFWVQTYIPQKDFFFLDDQTLDDLQEELSVVKVFPRKAFFDTEEYNTLDLNNSLMYWALLKEVSHVIIAPEEWINSLSLKRQAIILKSQIKMRQGMIFPYNIFPSNVTIPDQYFHQDRVVVQCSLWNSFSPEEQEEILSGYAQLWDGWTVEPLPDKTPSHLAKYANTFNTTHYGNCLAATIFAITSDEHVIHQWLSQEDFAKRLDQEGYHLCDETAVQQDVTVWLNADNVIQHAAFYLGNSLYFNKNGQTCFNPWTICKEEQLCKEWEHLDKRTYRRRVE